MTTVMDLRKPRDKILFNVLLVNIHFKWKILIIISVS